VQIADSAQLHVGDLAVAIGNPFGQEGTMTVGIISALGRLLPTDTSDPTAPHYNIPDIIQTDASINPGNSGGVLLDDQGAVIGVTSAIISPAGASAGVGFAIPSTIVQQVVPALISDGHYDHPYLGISGTTLTPDLAQAADLPADQLGALIGEVSPDSPADAANLRGSDRQVDLDGQQIVVGGDVITAVNDQPIHGMDDLITYLYRSAKVGDTVSLTILRDGKEQTVDVTLQARPRSDSQNTGTTETTQNNGNHAWLGIAGVTVNADLAQALNLDQNQDGVLIEQIEHNSPADEAGLHGSFKPVTINGAHVLTGGDIITAANDEAIHSIQDLQAAIAQAQPGDKMTLTILRDGKEQNITLTLGDRSN
jgi:S1-C subfamily serine protease